MLSRRYIHLVERNTRGAIVIYGVLGVRQYYGYPTIEARRRYLAECKEKLIFAR